MKEEMKYNLNAYLSQNSHKEFYINLLTIILFIFLLIFINIYKINNTIKIQGETICFEDACKITFYQYEFESVYDTCEINNQKYQIEDVTYGEISTNLQNIAYQQVELQIKDYEGKNNEIVTLKFNQNKETLIQKIKEIIVER